jgi:hypothetical protein
MVFRRKSGFRHLARPPTGALEEMDETGCYHGIAPQQTAAKHFPKEPACIGRSGLGNALRFGEADRSSKAFMFAQMRVGARPKNGTLYFQASVTLPPAWPRR